MTIFVKFKWRAHSNHLNTVWYSNGIFVSSYQMVVWKQTRLKKSVYGPKCQVFEWSTNSVTLPFEYRTPILSGIQVNLVFRCLVIRWLFNTWIPNSSEWVYGIHRQSSVKIHRHFAPAYLLGITRLLFTRLTELEPSIQDQEVSCYHESTRNL